MARRNIAHTRANVGDQEPAPVLVPASNYSDPERWQLEIDRIFKRVPLLVAFGSELREPDSYKAMSAAGVPILVTRTRDGEIKAFVNMCSHRGAIVVADGCGTARGFSCPYHGWAYDTGGRLVGITNRSEFGEVETENLGLTPLPAGDRAGMVFVGLTPGADLHLHAFLAGYDSVLDDLAFNDAYVVGAQPLDGPNWKVAYDGYRDFYHVPILHRNSFGPDGPFQPDYYSWGPHVRVMSPKGHEKLADTPESEWGYDDMTAGVWTVFPNMSIAGSTGTGYMVSQMFPGKTPGESFTIQNFLRFEPPEEQDPEELKEYMDFMGHVVGNEDYYTGFHVQKALATGAKEFSLFGRNEGGGQLFHKWVDALVDTEDADLPALLEKGVK